MRLSRCGSLPLRPLTGVWYRAIQPQFWPTALSTSHTVSVASRFSEGPASAAPFEILYLAENHLVALFEVQALLGSPAAGNFVPSPRHAWTILNVNVRLSRIADLRSARGRGVATAQELTGKWRQYLSGGSPPSARWPIGPAPTQRLGAELFAHPEIEGFISYSARMPFHALLVVFPQKMAAGSRVTFVHPASGTRVRIPERK